VTGGSRRSSSTHATDTVAQIPAHSHAFLASADQGNATSATGAVVAKTGGASIYNAGSNPVSMAPQAVSSTGGSQPHNNFQPYLCVDFIISLFGIFPSQT